MGGQLGGQVKLTAKFVESITAPGKYYDGNGVFLQVKPSGSKKWLQRYTINGRRREIGLGSAKLVSLAKVRKKAFNNLLLVGEGQDPIEEKRHSSAIPSFEDAARRVHADHLPSWRNPKHAAQFISTLETYAFPYIGKKLINDINSSHILQVLSPIWMTKEETAKRVRQRISTVMQWCIAKRWCSIDPADRTITTALPRQSNKVKHRKSISYDAVSDFINTIQKSNAGFSTKLAIEFLILTAARSGEVRYACWSEVNGNIWSIPAERMKSGVAHRVPLSKRCIQILTEAKTINLGSKFIFEGTRTNKPLSENTFNKLMKELGMAVHVHGFRTSFRTWTQEQTGYSREIAEAALAHSLKNKAEAAYARSDLLKKRGEMMESWSAYLSENSNNIISLTR